MRFYSLVSVLLFSVASLGAQLDLQLKSDYVLLLNATTKSCQQLYSGTGSFDDIASTYGSIPQMSLSWSGPSNLTVHYIQVSLQGPELAGQEYRAVLGGDQLRYTWYASTADQFRDVELQKNESQQNACPVKFGSVFPINRSLDARGTGSILVYGTFQNEAGFTEGITATAPFQFEYKGSN